MKDSLANFLGGVVGAGLGAALAVMGAVYVQRKEAQLAERLAEDRRRKDEKAAMAVLPLSLSELTQYARNCILLLDRYVRPDQSPSHFPADFEAARIPETAVGPLQLCARFADETNSAKIAKALGKLQVQQSRLRSWAQERRGAPVTELQRRLACGHMFDAADVHAALAALFEYSRDEGLVRERPSFQEIANALHTCSIWGDDHPIWETVRARQGHVDEPQV